MRTNKERETLARTLGAAYGSQDWMVTPVDRKAAELLVSAGYRIPKVLGYVITRNGHILNDTQYATRNEALDRTTWLNSCRLEGQAIDYRVAEIVESA